MGGLVVTTRCRRTDNHPCRLGAHLSTAAAPLGHLALIAALVVGLVLAWGLAGVWLAGAL